MSKLKSIYLIFTLSVLLLSPLFAEELDSSFTKVIGLGDSLMDTGNVFIATGGAIPLATRYYQGRFGNGPVMLDYLVRDLCDEVKPSLSADFSIDRCISYAWGGSGTGEIDTTPGGAPVPGLIGQVGLLSIDSGGTIDPDTLIVLWTGGNDFFLGLSPKTPKESVNNIGIALETLISMGAQNFVVLTFPDLGKTPIALAGNDAEQLTRTVKKFNRRLRKKINHVRSYYDDVEILVVNAFRLSNILESRHIAFGFSDTDPGPAAGCLFPPLDCSLVEFNTASFFWDELHFTTHVHKLIATVTGFRVENHF